MNRIASSVALVVCAAISGAWIQQGQWVEDRLCMASSVCADYQGTPSQCAVREYDLDDDGICDETCEKCAPLPDNNNEVYTCDTFPQMECFFFAEGKSCSGYLLVSPCLNGVCANLWLVTTQQCTFKVPNCKIDEL